MTCTRSLLLVLVTGCLNSDTDLSTSMLVEVTGDSSSSESTGSCGSGDTPSRAHEPVAVGRGEDAGGGSRGGRGSARERPISC